MKWSYFILFVSLFGMIFISCDSEKTVDETIEEPLPNIVLLVGDDQGYPYFGFMGADYVQTPNMDALADRGTLFTNGYVPENHCRPSLQTLMTGTLPIDYASDVSARMKIEMGKPSYLNLSEEEKETWKKNFDFHAMQYVETLPKHLAKKGYKSFQGGKWWEFTYKNGGFTSGMTTGWKEGDQQNEDWFLQFMGGDGRKLARATMQPVYDFVDSVKNDPFFIWFAPELPHYPFDAPDKYYSIYADQEMTESAKRYYANCTWFDDGVGELTRYLKEVGEYENTLFIYVNDNGWEQAPDQEFRSDSMRWHNGGDKGKLSMYDQSFRTPIIFSWPGNIESGVRKTDLIHSADIPATILDYVGLPIPNEYFGQSYRSVLDGETQNPRTEIIGNINQVRSTEDMMGKKLEGYWIRTPKWFLNWDANTDEYSMYNILSDPNNDKNVVKEHPETFLGLKGKLQAYRATKRKQ